MAVRDIIELEDVQFTGNSAYDDNGRFFVNNPGPINYSDATPEADDAWKNLTLERSMYHLLPKMTKESGEMVIDDVGLDIRTRLFNFRRRSKTALAQRLHGIGITRRRAMLSDSMFFIHYIAL